MGRSAAWACGRGKAGHEPTSEIPSIRRTLTARTAAAACTRLRNYFLTGVIVAAPLFLTVYITWSFIDWIDSWVKPFIPAAYNPDTYLPFVVPGFGLVVALVFLTLLGFLDRQPRRADADRPTARICSAACRSCATSIAALKQIFETVLSKRARSRSSTVGLIE